MDMKEIDTLETNKRTSPYKWYVYEVSKHLVDWSSIHEYYDCYRARSFKEYPFHAAY